MEPMCGTGALPKLHSVSIGLRAYHAYAAETSLNGLYIGVVLNENLRDAAWVLEEDGYPALFENDHLAQKAAWALLWVSRDHKCLFPGISKFEGLRLGAPEGAQDA